MEIRWTEEAAEKLEDNLDFWIEKNKSNEYSLKIIQQVELVEKAISENPYFLANYIKSLNLYKRNFFNGKFSLLYEVIEEQELIYIKLFRSNREKPID